jgi:heat shock protein HtpX
MPPAELVKKGAPMNTSRSFFEEQLANRRRTIVFAVVTAAWMLAVGFWTVFLQFVLFGALASMFNVYPTVITSDVPFHSGLIGATVALALWLVAALALFWQSASIIPRAVGARAPDGPEATRLARVLNRVLLSSGNASRKPALFVWSVASVNAFAVGRSIGDGSIVVTNALVAQCDDDELEAVLAHELAHLQNGDALHVTQAVCAASAVLVVLYLGATLAVIAGAVTAAVIALIVNVASENDSGIGCFLAIFGVAYALSFGLATVLLITIVFVPITVIAGIALRCAASGLSQTREYLADACAAQWTRNPAKLAALLRRIEGGATALPLRGTAAAPLLLVENQIAGPRAKLRPVDDFFTRGAWSGFLGFLLRSHPPVHRRALLLDQMAGFDRDGWRLPPLNVGQRLSQILAVAVPVVLVAGAVAAIPWQPSAREWWLGRPPAQHAQTLPTWHQAKVTADRVRLRQSPNTDSAILGELPRGTTLLVGQRRPGNRPNESWTEVSFDGRTAAGWVASQFLQH